MNITDIIIQIILVSIGAFSFLMATAGAIDFRKKYTNNNWQEIAGSILAIIVCLIVFYTSFYYLFLIS